MTVDPRTPVLVGVGTSHADAEALLLMVEAARAAGDDCGADLLGRVERIAVTKGTWSYRDPGRYIGLQIGAPAARTALVEVGIPQQTVIDEILVGLRDGELDVALVVGGESRAHEARRHSRSASANAEGIADAYLGGSVQTTLDLPDTAPDDHRFPQGDLVDEAEIAAGLWAPVEQYATLENAVAAAEGRTPDQARDEIAALCERCNRVARSNPEAAFPSRWTRTTSAPSGPAIARSPSRTRSGMRRSGPSTRRRPCCSAPWRLPRPPAYPATDGSSRSSASVRRTWSLLPGAPTCTAGRRCGCWARRPRRTWAIPSPTSNWSTCTAASRSRSGSSSASSASPSTGHRRSPAGCASPAVRSTTTSSDRPPPRPALVAAATTDGIVGRDLALLDGQVSAASPSPG